MWEPEAEALLDQIGVSNKLEVGRSGTDCGDTSHYLPTVTDAQEGDLVQDVFQGEIATLYNVKDRGLVVIASCGHSGIINTVRYAQPVTTELMFGWVSESASFIKALERQAVLASA